MVAVVGGVGVLALGAAGMLGLCVCCTGNAPVVPADHTLSKQHADAVPFFYGHAGHYPEGPPVARVRGRQRCGGRGAA